MIFAFSKMLIFFAIIKLLITLSELKIRDFELRAKDRILFHIIPIGDVAIHLIVLLYLR